MNPPPRFDLEAVLAQRDFIRSIARGLLGNDEQAEDVVQDTCLLAISRPPRRRDALRAWMGRVARNLALNARKREVERPERERRAARPERVSSDEEGDLELEQEVVEAVRALPSKPRTAIYLRYYKGLGPAAIAQELGVPVSTVKTRLARGLSLVRADLDRRHGSRGSWSHALIAFALPELGSAIGTTAATSASLSPVHGALWKGLLLMNKPLLATTAALAAAVSLVLLTDPFGKERTLQPTPDPGPETAAAAETASTDVDLEPVATPADEPAPAAARTALEIATDESSTPQPARGDGLFGRVVDALGQPVSGAEVGLRGGTHGMGGRFVVSFPSGVGEPNVVGQGTESTTTDGRGRFRLPIEEDGLVDLVVDAEGFAPFRKELTAYYGRKNDAGVLQLVPEVVLSGRVVDEAGQPVEGAVVRSAEHFGPANVLSPVLASTLAGGGASPGTAVTDAGGHFVVGRQAAGPWSLSVSSERFQSATLTGKTEVGGERVEDLEIVLATGFEISGRVTGRPADAGSLWVRAFPEQEGANGLPTMRRLRIGGGPVNLGAARVAKVGVDGSFALGGLSAGRYRLSAYDSAEAFGGRSRTENAVARTGDAGIELAWSAGASLRFQVIDASSKEPIEEVAVSAGSRFPIPVTEGGRPRNHFANGEVQVEGLRGEGRRPTTSVHVTADGYAPYEQESIPLPQNGAVLDLGIVALERVPMAYVTVVDGQGRPVEGAEVELAADTGGEATGPGQIERRVSITLGGSGSAASGGRSTRGITNAEGVAAFPSRPGHDVRVRVTSKRHASYESEPVLVPERADFTHTALLLTGGSVEVLVTDVHGDPLPGARVEHREITGEDAGFAPLAMFMETGARQRTTDSEGKALFRNLAAGDHAFRLTKESSGSGWFGTGSGGNFVTFRSSEEDQGPPWTEVEVAEGSERQVVLSKQPRGMLTGTVTENGLALLGASLTLSAKGEDDHPGLPGLSSGPHARSDGDGAYEFEDVHPGTYTLRVTHPDRAMPSEYEVEVSGNTSYFDVNLDLAIVEGRITDAEGRGIAGARVTPARAVEGGRRPVMVMMTRTTDGSDSSTSVSTSLGDVEPVRTDAKGYYVLRGVPSDERLQIEVDADGYSSASSETFEVDPDQVLRNVDLVLEKGGSARVVVHDADGNPAPSVLVLLRRMEGEATVGTPEVGMTNADGVVTFPELRVGPWQASARLVGPDGGEGPEPQVLQIVAGREANARLDMP